MAMSTFDPNRTSDSLNPTHRTQGDYIPRRAVGTWYQTSRTRSIRLSTMRSSVWDPTNENLIMKFVSSVRLPAVALLSLAAICTGPASAQQVEIDDLVAWARATPGGARSLPVWRRGYDGAAFMNSSNRAAKLFCHVTFTSRQFPE
jgi:hypothetical protein